MSDQKKQELKRKIVINGPGAQLQTARIEQNISIEDIARQMNLSTKILQSIEEDDYSDIQSPVFVRGYLRTYARLMGLDEDGMIKLFAEVYHYNEPEIKSISNASLEISSNDIRVKWMTYAVVLGLIMLISVWWVNNYRSTTNSDEVSQLAGMTHAEIPHTAMPHAENSVDETSDFTDATMATEIADILVAKPIDDIATVEEIEAITISDDVVLPQQENNATKNTEATSSLDKKEVIKEVRSISGSDVLELNIVATSWADIQDAIQFSFIKSLLHAGSSYRFVGEAPFKVYLGNGHGVEIKLNGQDFDFSKHIRSRNNTARFELKK